MQVTTTHYALRPTVVISSKTHQIIAVEEEKPATEEVKVDKLRRVAAGRRSRETK